MSDVEPRDTHHRALALNLDAAIYGTLAEIGAGQEVARWFLHVGAASGTVARTISAYDMTMSDSIYGKVGRYVSRDRVAAMLAIEYELLVGRLDAARGDKTRFFVFADSISARNYAGTNECHGWVGMRFQTEPRGPSSDVFLHVNLLDDTNVRQQEAVGILGVNLIWSAYHARQSVESFLSSLLDKVTKKRIEIDLIEGSGPAFQGLDARATLAELVHGGHAPAVLFRSDGQLLPPSEEIHKHPLVLAPGVYEQVAPIHGDMLGAAARYAKEELGASEREPLPLFVLTPRPVDAAETAAVNIILARVDALHGLGYDVLVVREPEAYLLVHYLNRYTNAPIRIVVGVSTLAQILQERHYGGLHGQLLEGLGKLFASNVRIYVHPMRGADYRAHVDGTPMTDWIEAGDEDLVTAESIRAQGAVAHLHAYLTQMGFLQSIPHSRRS